MIPSDRLYTADDLWVKTDENIATVGITDHAQHGLGDIVFVELPEPERDLGKGSACAVIESVKAATEIAAPLEGRVLETNALLTSTPEVINNDPYGDGWLIKLQLTGRPPLDSLLDADAYEALLTAHA